MLSISAEPLLTVTNRVSPTDPAQDEVYEFTRDRQSRTFGRDDSASDIVIWSAIGGNKLARVAGEIWRWGPQLWLRNLSTSHELDVVVPGQPPELALRRRKDESVLGAACSLPEPFCTVVGPDGCVLDVVQQRQPSPELVVYGLEDPTVNEVPEVPERLKVIAAALCEPLLLGNKLPAAYTEVMARIGEPSRRLVRGKVEDLTAFYVAAVPELAAESKRRAAAADASLTTVRKGLIYSFQQVQPSVPGRPGTLNLPVYCAVARLLVRHWRITFEDLRLLPDPPPGP